MSLISSACETTFGRIWHTLGGGQPNPILAKTQFRDGNRTGNNLSDVSRVTTGNKTVIIFQLLSFSEKFDVHKRTKCKQNFS